MEYDDIIVGAGSSGAALAARLSEDQDRNVLLLEAGPDYSTVDQTPADLLNTWISAGPHDWGLVAQATPARGIPYPRGKVTEVARRSTAISRCAAPHRTSTSGPRGVIASGASRRSCRSIANSRMIATRAAIFMELADRSGSSVRARRRGSLSIAAFSKQRAHKDTRKFGTITIPIPQASAHGPATAGKASAYRRQSAIWRPRAIA